MRDLRTIYERQVDTLSEAIVTKASGVFLWVVLACRSSVEGLEKADGISDLRKRHDALPPKGHGVILCFSSETHCLTLSPLCPAFTLGTQAST